MKHPRTRWLGALLLVFGAGHGWAQSSNAETFVREDIRTFSRDPVKVGKLREAVRILRGRAHSAAESWFVMAAIHGIPRTDPDLPAIPADIRRTFDQCHKDRSVLFVWHRAYVAAMERLMQDAIKDPTFRLPYWNWGDDSTLPAAFQKPFLDPAGKIDNPLYIAGRSDDAEKGRSVWASNWRTKFDGTSYRDFERMLFGTEHGEIHMAVDGNMSDTRLAGRDPIFYLHHANIDRLLMAWIKGDEATHIVPNAIPGWETGDYVFPSASGALQKPTFASLAMQSTAPMGYGYESLKRPVATPIPLPAKPPVMRALSSPSGDLHIFSQVEPRVGMTIAVGAPTTIELPIRRRNDIQKLRSRKDVAPQGGLDIDVVFEDVRLLRSQPGVLSYQVFVDLPKAAQDAPYDAHYLGTISLFDLPRVEADHSSDLRFTLTSGHRMTLAAQKFGASSVSISLVPQLSPGAAAPTAPSIAFAEVRLEVNEQ